MGSIVLLHAVGAAPGQAARIENEYKLSVPDELTAEVWRYLHQRYENVQDLLGPHGGQFRSSFADERYFDQYFDTADLTLLHMEGGIRHRRRFVVSGEDHSKHGRELVQIKASRPGDLAVNRTEIKFPVRRNKTVRDREDAHPVIGLVQPDEREGFRDAVAELGIDATELSPSVALEQRRRRVYIHRDDQPFATLTLDEVTASEWYRSIRYVELEMELNENAYTAADNATRDDMQAINDAIKADLNRAFPQVVQDQTPKYNKAFNAISDSFLWYPTARRIGVAFEILFLAGGVLLAFAMFRFLRRPRADKTDLLVREA